MVLPSDIKGFIENGLASSYVQVEGDGHHFEAVIVSELFRGLTRIAQHQLVYKALGQRMEQEIHALSLKTLTPEEWQNRSDVKGH